MPDSPVNPLTPKGKIVALTGGGSNWSALMNFDSRLDSIILFNLSGVTINVSFQETSLFIPLAASASLNLDTFDLAATEMYKIAFTATASASVNMVWLEGQGIGYVWRKWLMLGRRS